MEELEKQAREKFYFLDTINEFNRLLNLGIYPGKERKSVQKMADYLEKLFKTTIEEIQSNDWYISEKAAIESIDIAAVMHGGSGEYDPNYKVKMEDVFRKQLK